jgi:hypothetical protein
LRKLRGKYLWSARIIQHGIIESVFAFEKKEDNGHVPVQDAAT